MTDLSDAQSLIDAEADICAHMNNNHADAGSYATKLLGAPERRVALRRLRSEGWSCSTAAMALRLPFARRVTSPGVLRQVLKQFAEEARQ